MIDPRFAHAGPIPFPPGYGAQQVPIHQHRRRHHHHRKHKHGAAGESPLSPDESIHKVDHGHHHFQQNDGIPLGGGYGVPYVADGFGMGAVGGFHPQPPQFIGGNFGYNNQYQGNVYNQGQFGGPGTPGVKHRRRHHRHHHQTTEAANVTTQAQGVPEQLIGQRSSSVVGEEAPNVRSPAPPAEGAAKNEQWAHHHRHHRHHRHHQGVEHSSFGQVHQSRHRQGHTTAGVDGYGHLNDDLIFIERGEHSPHRQEPPAGYEYKGKIEVQGIDREYRSRSRGQGSFIPPATSHIPAPPPHIPTAPHIPMPQSVGPCPPGWQQMILTAAPGGPCPPGAPCPPGGTMYTGQLVGSAGIAQQSYVGMGSFGAVTSTGVTATSGDGLANLAASLPIPPQGQLVADYIIESSAGGISSTGGSGFLPDCQQTARGTSGSFTEQHHGEQVDEHVSGRATIIEVWQKRHKTDVREEESARRSPITAPSFDLERFRNEILGAIERMVQSGGPGTKIQWTGHDGGTQTQIHPSYEDKKIKEIRPTTSEGGEVRVIVQPIQPVFYMPRQTEGATIVQPQVGPAPAIQQASSAAPNVVYVPRNVYVPVIKPVFVPRERVIVRPQVIHVARPVLVDRPVPVTQRPIIIDRERPIPVPVRSANQGAAQAGGTKTVREEYVYRDNLPVAYGGRCAEYSGGVDYGYMPNQHEHQYAASSTHEVTSGYETQGPVINVNVPEQFQHSQSNIQLNVQPQGGETFHESYTNLARSSSVSAVDAAPLHCTAPIEILDATVNPTWQRTDRSSFVRQYGRPAYDICQKTEQVEQQMYQELRHGTSSADVQRSESAASYVSGHGVGVNNAGFVVNSGSFSSMPLDDLQNLNQEAVLHRGSSNTPVCINY